MEFILSPKNSTIPDDEISLDTLALFWNTNAKRNFIKEMNSHNTNSFYTQINQDTFLSYVYGNIRYFHQTVVPKMVNGWSDKKLVGFYNEDDLDEIADNFTKEFNSLIGDKPYKIKKHVVLIRALEDRFLELLSLFPSSRELIAKLNYRVEENRVKHVLSIQPALNPAGYFDYRFGSYITPFGLRPDGAKAAYESHLRHMTMFHPKLEDVLLKYKPDYREDEAVDLRTKIDFLNFIIDVESHSLDSALQYFFATAVLNYDEIHYIFDLSSDQINKSMMFSNERIKEVENVAFAASDRRSNVKFKRPLTPTFIFNLALDFRKLALVESEEAFKTQLDKVISYFRGDNKLLLSRHLIGDQMLNSYVYREDRDNTISITPYVTATATITRTDY